MTLFYQKEIIELNYNPKMTKYIILIAYCFLIVFNQTTAQDLFVTATIIDSNNSKPVENARVSIPNIDSDLTNSSGEFTLDLNRCSTCASGDEIVINIQHKKYGFFQESITISKNGLSIIKLSRKDVSIISGYVYDVDSGGFIRDVSIGITISPSVNQWKGVDIMTDEFGRFEFRIQNRLIEKNAKVNLFINDKLRRYIDIVYSEKINSSLIKIGLRKSNNTLNSDLNQPSNDLKNNYSRELDSLQVMFFVTEIYSNIEATMESSNTEYLKFIYHGDILESTNLLIKRYTDFMGESKKRRKYYMEIEIYNESIKGFDLYYMNSSAFAKVLTYSEMEIEIYNKKGKKIGESLIKGDVEYLLKKVDSRWKIIGETGYF